MKVLLLDWYKTLSTIIYDGDNEGDPISKFGIKCCKIYPAEDLNIK